MVLSPFHCYYSFHYHFINVLLLLTFHYHFVNVFISFRWRFIIICSRFIIISLRLHYDFIDVLLTFCYRFINVSLTFHYRLQIYAWVMSVRFQRICFYNCLTNDVNAKKNLEVLSASLRNNAVCRFPRVCSFSGSTINFNILLLKGFYYFREDNAVSPLIVVSLYVTFVIVMWVFHVVLLCFCFVRFVNVSLSFR